MGMSCFLANRLFTTLDICVKCDKQTYSVSQDICCLGYEWRTEEKNVCTGLTQRPGLGATCFLTHF